MKNLIDKYNKKRSFKRTFSELVGNINRNQWDIFPRESLTEFMIKKKYF